jgi:hypothetical protein
MIREQFETQFYNIKNKPDLMLDSAGKYYDKEVQEAWEKYIVRYLFENTEEQLTLEHHEVRTILRMIKEFQGVWFDPEIEQGVYSGKALQTDEIVTGYLLRDIHGTYINGMGVLSDTMNYDYEEVDPDSVRSVKRLLRC